MSISLILLTLLPAHSFEIFLCCPEGVNHEEEIQGQSKLLSPSNGPKYGTGTYLIDPERVNRKVDLGEVLI